jgi:palmitoyltransferase
MVSRKIKFLIPKDRGELIPMFFIIFVICVYVIFELCVILPTIYHNIFTYKEIFHLIFGFYIIFNLLGNLYLCMITDTTIDTIICPVLLPTATVTTLQQDMIFYYCNWHYCYSCEVNVPPRSHHCHLCKKCILKRDHHCSFLGHCIGFRNVRYYLCFLIWSCVRKKIKFSNLMKFFFFRLVYFIVIFFIWIIHMNLSVLFHGVL